MHQTQKHARRYPYGGPINEYAARPSADLLHHLRQDPTRSFSVALRKKLQIGAHYRQRIAEREDRQHQSEYGAKQAPEDTKGRSQQKFGDPADLGLRCLEHVTLPFGYCRFESGIPVYPNADMFINPLPRFRCSLDQGLELIQKGGDNKPDQQSDHDQKQQSHKKNRQASLQTASLQPNDHGIEHHGHKERDRTQKQRRLEDRGQRESHKDQE